MNYSESPKTTEAGASVESFCRLSARTVVYGRMSYDNFTGRDMAGSAFVCPDRRPFDIVEDSVTNLGRKHRDTYNLVGAVGVDLWRGLSVGGRVAYTSANYAKYKDLRHKNLFMNLDVAAGLTLPLGRSVTLGANYFYRRNTESLEFSTYGKGDKVYKSLVAYAVFTGRVEQFGGDGFTDSNTSMPLLDEHHGMAAQLELRPSGAFAWYHEASMAWREGYYGRRSPYTIQYTRHDSKLYTYRTRLSYRRPSAVHHLDLSFEAENLQNKLNTYRELTNDAGSHYYEYYDPVKAANKVWVSGSVAYTGYLGVVGRPANEASPSSARIGTGAVGVAWKTRLPKRGERHNPDARLRNEVQTLVARPPRAVDRAREMNLTRRGLRRRLRSVRAHKKTREHNRPDTDRKERALEIAALIQVPRARKKPREKTRERRIAKVGLGRRRRRRAARRRFGHDNSSLF